MTTTAEKTDISIRHDGSVVLFTVNTPAAREWVEENVQLEGWQWMGKSSFAVDARFAHDLADGMQGDGLEIE